MTGTVRVKQAWMDNSGPLLITYYPCQFVLLFCWWLGGSQYEKVFLNNQDLRSHQYMTLIFDLFKTCEWYRFSRCQGFCWFENAIGRQ